MRDDRYLRVIADLSKFSSVPGVQSAVPFGTSPVGVSLAGVPVRAGVTYSRAECEQMQVDKTGKARVVFGHPPQAPRSRL